MRKAKVISETGLDSFEKELNKWLSENEAVDVISMSHSSTELSMHDAQGHLMKGYELSAVILYHEEGDIEQGFGI